MSRIYISENVIYIPIRQISHILGICCVFTVMVKMCDKGFLAPIDQHLPGNSLSEVCLICFMKISRISIPEDIKYTPMRQFSIHTKCVLWCIRSNNERVCHRFLSTNRSTVSWTMCLFEILNENIPNFYIRGY